MMALHQKFLVMFIAQLLLLAGLVAAGPLISATGDRMKEVRSETTNLLASSASGYWVGSIKRQGTVAFGNNSDYQVYRNVKDFGAVGDGSTDDTDAINAAISSGQRCGLGCDSSTTTPALVYFPPGTYMVSKPIVQYYYTQLVGDALNLPVLKATASFSGMAVIDADPYTDTGANWYTNQNNFFRAIRNFVIDLTAMPQNVGAGIHWQVGQATSLQNIRFEMIKGGGDANKQQGIFMDNGSGGFMTDLVFNGGNYGMFLGNQQFTTRNLTFNNCNTAIFMNWNWAWTFKSLHINNCGAGLNMSNSPQNQTVGSVLILDSHLTNTPTGVVTAWSKNSIPVGGGTLVLENVDFSGSDVAVASIDGSTILEGGSVVSNWVQGNTYRPSKTVNKRAATPSVEVVVETIVETVYDCGEESTSVPLDLPSSTSTELRTADAETAGQILPIPSFTIAIPPLGTLSLPGFNPPTTSEPEPSATDTPAEIPVETPLETPTATYETTTSASSHPLFTSSSLSTPESSSSAPVHAPSQCPGQTITKSRIQSPLSGSSISHSLLDGSGKVFERSKPLYESYPASAFVSVKSAGAKGDGSTDDTAAIQKVLNQATEDQIVYFDHGAYVITDTIKVPKNIKITGEIWPLLMAHGKKFSDQHNPIPLLQVGEPGETGSVEISDLVLETKGPAPGAILMQWNVAETSHGSAGLWDVHFRIGGSAGTQLQSNKCAKTPKQTTEPNPECIGAFMLLHITEKSTAYLENVWVWTADHELDLGDHNQINVYNGRGVLVESQGPVWMYGTASEHHQLYNYQVSNAQNVFMALIQTETPYYQSNPTALVPFTPQDSWNDPDFAHCTTNACRKAWGLRVLNSSDLYIYGAGLYSFFENYEQQCIGENSCQENMVEVDCSDVRIYGLSTVATVNMVTSSSGQSLVPQEGNKSNFCSTIALFEQS